MERTQRINTYRELGIILQKMSSDFGGGMCH
jgi:hypothetical protein